MTTLHHKIDFALILSVKNANPNGNPLDNNRPRVTYDGIGEISDVCLKRKLRDRLQESGQAIFVQSDDRKVDGMESLKNRAESAEFGLGKDAFDAKKTSRDATAKAACAKWFDVRAFGQLFAFGKPKKPKKTNSKTKDIDGVLAEDADEVSAKDTDGASTKDADGVSIPIRGPLTIQSAFSIEPVSITSTQITKSVSGEGDGNKRGSDTMGMKHRVDNSVYVTFGSINPQLAERTGFSDDDAEIIKAILPRLFENDASSARPEGSMAVLTAIWWKHNCKSGQYSSARVHRSLHVKPDGSFALDTLDGLAPEPIPGF